MDIRTFLRTSSPEERERVARAAGTEVSYLYRLASDTADPRNRRLPSPQLVERLIEADSRFTIEDLRPDLAALVAKMTRVHSA
jgi:hypothetical protein